MPSKKSKLRWFGIAVFTLIILLAASVLVVLLISSTRLQAQMANSGRIRTIEEIIGPKIPDEQNAALLLETAFKELERPGMREILTPVRTIEMGAPEDFRREPNKAAELEAAVDKAAPLVTLVNQAVKRPKCQFTRNWSDPFGAFGQYYFDMRSLAEIVSYTALVRAHQGRMQEAIDVMDAGLKMVKAAKYEPTLYSQSIGNSVLYAISKRLRLLPLHGHITEEQAKTLYDTISGIDFTGNFTECMESERAAGLWLYKEVRKDPKAFAAMMNSSSGPYHSSSRTQRITRDVMNYAKRPLLGFDQAAFMKGMQVNIEASKYTYREAQAKRLYVEDSDLPKYAVIARLMTPLMNYMNMARDRGISEADGSRIFLALLAYKDRYKSYPATLKELRDKLGWKLPKDIFSGKDFIYKRRGEGFLLYGVGMNMKDDGGTPSKSNPRKGDMVWELKR